MVSYIVTNSFSTTKVPACGVACCIDTVPDRAVVWGGASIPEPVGQHYIIMLRGRYYFALFARSWQAWTQAWHPRPYLCQRHRAQQATGAPPPMKMRVRRHQRLGRGRPALALQAPPAGVTRSGASTVPPVGLAPVSYLRMGGEPAAALGLHATDQPLQQRQARAVADD